MDVYLHFQQYSSYMILQQVLLILAQVPDNFTKLSQKVVSSTSFTIQYVVTIVTGLFKSIFKTIQRGCRDRIVVGFTITYAISGYHH
jgi:hypothetical protein